MSYIITEPTPANIVVTEASVGPLTIAEAQPCAITIDETNQPLITLQQPAAALVSVVVPAAASLTISQPAAAVTVLVSETGSVDRDYLGATPTYVSGVLTAIAYTNGTSKAFTYSPPGILSTIDYIDPNQPTLRKTLTWVNGVWQGTSAPVVI